jgi:hypothetical protein
MHIGFQNELGLAFGGLIIVRADKQGDRAEDSAAMTVARIAQYQPVPRPARPFPGIAVPRAL